VWPRDLHSSTGRTVEEAFRIEARDLELLVGGLPDGKGQYAHMAVDALASALGEL
jgi:hypothetical protein